MSRLDVRQEAYGKFFDGASTAATVEGTNSIVLHGRRHVHAHVVVSPNTDAAGTLYFLTRNRPGETWYVEPVPAVAVSAGVAIAGQGVDFYTEAAEVGFKYVRSSGGGATQLLTVSFNVKD